MYAKSATTLANILEAARKLFLNKNYADVTMAEIAGQAEVTKGALYHHFESKEALYEAMLHADLQEKQALLEEAAKGGGRCRDRLRRLMLSFLELPREKREVMKLVRRDINIFENPTRDKLVRAYQVALPEQVETIVRDGIEAGELTTGDAQLLAWQFVAMVEVVLARYAQCVLGDHEQMTEYVLKLFFEGAGA